MKRRGFMQVLLSIAGVSGMAGVVARPIFGQSPQRRLLIQQSPLAGFQYHAGEAVWSLLNIGDALQLVREPQNLYDTQAVRIDWHGHKLGYLPRKENTAICQMLDRGYELKADIYALRNAANPWDRIGLAIFLEG